nr:hypothetical protein [Tanacetum cinerariifolium]
MIKIYYLCANLANFTDMALPPRDQRHQYLRCEGLQYTDADIVDFKMRLARIYKREVHRVQVFDCKGLPDLMADGLKGRMLMEHWDDQGQRDFLGTPPFYTFIMDHMLRLCHKLIACSIDRRIQAPKKGAMISGGQYVARLVERFGLLTEERLQGLTMIVRELHVIDMAELDAPIADEVALAIPVPVQAPQPPPPAAGPTQTLAQSYWTLTDDDQAGVRTKTGSKFNTIVHEYVTKPSTLSKSRAELRRESVYKSVKAEEKSNLKTSLLNQVKTAVPKVSAIAYIVGAYYGYNCPPKVLIIPNPEPCNNQTIDELPQTLSSFDPTCYSGNEIPFTCDSTPNIVDDSPNVFNPPPQPPKYSYEFCGNDAYYGHDFPPQVPFTYDPESCYNQDFNFPHNPQNFQQQYLFCTSCGGLHETFQSWSKNTQQKKEEEEKQIAEEQAAKARYWKIPICYDNDEDYTIETTPNEPDNSLSMGGEHLDTILAIELDEFIKSSVENLVPNPSEFEGEHECDMPACDDFTTFSNLLFDVDDDFSSSDDESFSDEDILKKIYSNPLFDEVIISMKIDPHHFNAESDLIKSLLNHDSSIISSSSKINSLLDEFTGELTLLKSIPPRINETDCDPEEEIRLIKKLLYNNSSPRPPEEFISENSDVAIESFSPSPIPVEDSDSFMQEMDLSFPQDDSIPPGIEEDDYDSERDILILEELLSNDSLSLPENKSFHFDIPSSSRPLAKPLDGNLGILNVKVMGDIFEHNVPMPRLMLTQPTLVPNQEKSPNFLSHQGHEASQPSTECPMMIYERNTSILDVPFLHFYPL